MASPGGPAQKISDSLSIAWLVHCGRLKKDEIAEFRMIEALNRMFRRAIPTGDVIAPDAAVPGADTAAASGAAPAASGAPANTAEETTVFKSRAASRFVERGGVKLRWSKNERLGQGGFGTVCRGQLKRPDRGSADVVAVKVSNCSGAEQRRRHERAELTLSYQHPNLVSTLCVFAVTCSEFTGVVTVMELGGETLDRYIVGSSASEETIRTLCLHAARGVHWLHEKAMVHCDVHARNVFVFGRIAKLGDLESVRKAGECTDEATPTFVAPEAWDGPVSPPRDVWAWGFLLHVALCSELPLGFRGVDDLPPEHVARAQELGAGQPGKPSLWAASLGIAMTMGSVIPRPDAAVPAWATAVLDRCWRPVADRARMAEVVDMMQTDALDTHQ
eukprot:TRINITY_DN56046_c0_g1_i1.p1 TRINITY_DN56046_c0_g1~~TRINITY_DN56046_c0_g1_i1.p1  ORF type:complete len:420 (+),score=84.46 TRINITY_DN56046_c0_g1_i1:95-1261(+)